MLRKMRTDFQRKLALRAENPARETLNQRFPKERLINQSFLRSLRRMCYGAPVALDS